MRLYAAPVARRQADPSFRRLFTHP